MSEYIGAKISLISKSDIRYVGILHEINSDDSTVALEQVRSYGTEGRRGKDAEVPPSDNVFEYIVFRGSDVKDLKVEEPAKKVEPPPRGVPDDPAILTATAAPPRPQQSPNYPSMQGYRPPPPPGYRGPYGNYQYPPPHFGGPGGYRPPPQHMSPPQGYVYQNYPPGVPPVPPTSASNPQVLPPPPPPAPPAPPQQEPAPTVPAIVPLSPSKEAKPDTLPTTAPVPTPAKSVPAQSIPKPTTVTPTKATNGVTSKSTTVVPAMPIPITIPSQPKSNNKPVPKPTAVPSSTPAAPVEAADITKTMTAADIQNLVKKVGETKVASTSAPGAGTFLTSPLRRRQFPGATSRPMDQDYDFESANAKFNKEEVAREVAAASGVSGAGPSAEQLAAALEKSNDAKYYDKGKSFFDNISCENKDRGENPESSLTTWKRGEERKLNMETFGQASVDGGRYGRGGYYPRGRGGWRGSRGFRGRGANPFRGASTPRNPVQSTSTDHTTGANSSSAATTTTSTA